MYCSVLGGSVFTGFAEQGVLKGKMNARNFTIYTHGFYSQYLRRGRVF